MLLVILAIAALAILAGVFQVSRGRGGELTEFPPDVPPLNLPEAGKLTAVDFMALHLPVNLVGYHTQSVDEALHRAANAISARDTRIAILEQRVSELLSSRLHARQEVYAAPGNGPRTEHEPPALPLALPVETDPLSNGHVPSAVREEPPSAEHEPVTWIEPAAPDNPAPSDAAPSNPAPSDAAPSNPAPSDAAPSNPAPSDAAPSNPAPSDAVTSDPDAPDAAVPDRVADGDAGGQDRADREPGEKRDKVEDPAEDKIEDEWGESSQDASRAGRAEESVRVAGGPADGKPDGPAGGPKDGPAGGKDADGRV
ncbi:hypothetical protein OUY22_12115 [Nonomuraea sp. MCN248]|uniref:DivIVA domain-containing protein n=1 Tax=Nonomuraea corallina TaxID=2989783 RepID=A0ABT4SAD1_9ACTN|nr:hypothetical protein [Nonomuraea corallina]MDA0634162.1 hypothetical protein [Nonomuraea corallina]